MLFTENKYTKIYYDIIIRGVDRGFKTKKAAKAVLGYVEKHHIIPRSLGGSDEKNNLVFLTGREHFICHLLLTRMTTGNNKEKMIFAVANFINRKKNKADEYKVSSRIYEALKKQHSEAISKRLKGRPAHNKGKTQDAESNKKRSDALKGRKQSEQHKKNSALSRTGKPHPLTESGLKKVVDAAKLRKGISLTPEQIKARLGNVWWNDGVKETRSKTQPSKNHKRGRLRKSLF